MIEELQSSNTLRSRLDLCLYHNVRTSMSEWRRIGSLSANPLLYLKLYALYLPLDVYVNDLIRKYDLSRIHN